MPYTPPGEAFQDNSAPVGGGLGHALDAEFLNAIIAGVDDADSRLTAVENGFLSRLNGFAVVVHNADSAVARPSNAPAVYWIGTVQPAGLQDQDLWWNPVGQSEIYEPFNGTAAGALASGESTCPRLDATASNLTATGSMRLSYFTATKTETIFQVAYFTGGTAAAATPTLVRYGVYQEAGNGDLTLVASTANDTTLFAAAGTAYPKNLVAAWSKTRGTRYAIGRLVVTAVQVPSLLGRPAAAAGAGAGIWFATPKLTAQATGLTDLPSTITAASLTSSVFFDYAEARP